MFIGRNSELESLEREYKRREASFVVIYGRRRVGKTTLIKEFIKNKSSIYFLASEEIEGENIKYIQQLICDFTGDEILKSANFNKWEDIFRFIPRCENREKLVVVIDEFQYLCINNSSFPSIFQRIWDEILKDKNIMLIICGSYMSMMENLTLSYNSPLYGRRTAQIRLRPLCFAESSKFYSTLGIENSLEWYSVTGGIPKYIEIFSSYDRLDEAMLNEAINKDSFLYEEPYFLFKKEVEQLNTYFSILKTIAFGNEKISKISSSLNINGNIIGKYLSVLQNLDVIKREVPVTENNPSKSKKGLYKIQDNFINFWLKFILPNSSYIEIGKKDYVVNLLERNFIDSHVAYVFENVCKEYMWSVANLPFQPLKVGRWWDGKDEIDIVALNEIENKIIFGECKYWNNKVGVNILNSLKEKSERVNFGNKSTEKYFILFSKSGFSDELIHMSQKSEVILVENILQ